MDQTDSHSQLFKTKKNFHPIKNTLSPELFFPNSAASVNMTESLL